MKVYEAVANALRECGGGHLFGLMGDGNLRFIDYWVRSLEMPYFGSRHESAAVAMADGFTRISDTFAVATTTQGPGLTNALTALVESVHVELGKRIEDPAFSLTRNNRDQFGNGQACLG